MDVKEFLNTEFLKAYSDNVQNIIIKLIELLNKEGIQFIIKIRKDNSVVFSPIQNDSKNILTFWIYKEHIRLKIYKVMEKVIRNINEIDPEIIYEVKKKYQEFNVEKRQISIYLKEETIEQVQNLCIERKNKVNEFVVNAIEEKVSGFFVNNEHKKEFRKFLIDFGLYDKEDKYLSTLEKDQLKKLIFAYLVSPYQAWYLESEGVKFSYNSEKNSFSGPSSIIEDWEEGLYNPAEMMFGVAKEIVEGEINIKEFIDIISEADEVGYKLIINAFKLFQGRLRLVEDEIKPPKVLEVDIGDFEL